MSAAWAWALVLGPPLAWVAGYDAWAKVTGHWTLSRQAHDWLFSPTIGPVVVAVGAGAFTWFLLHLLRYHARL